MASGEEVAIPSFKQSPEVRAKKAAVLRAWRAAQKTGAKPVSKPIKPVPKPAAVPTPKLLAVPKPKPIVLPPTEPTKPSAWTKENFQSEFVKKWDRKIVLEGENLSLEAAVDINAALELAFSRIPIIPKRGLFIRSDNKAIANVQEGPVARGERAKAYYDTRYKTIYTKEKTGGSYWKGRFLHELGHAVDFDLPRRRSLWANWTKVHAATDAPRRRYIRGFGAYPVEDPSELFAESYSKAVLGGKGAFTRSGHPEIGAYFQEVLGWKPGK